MSTLEMIDKHNKSPLGLKDGFITTFKFSGSGLGLSEEEIRLQVALKADGSIATESTSRWVVRLKKQRKIDRFRILLDEAGKEFKYYKDEGGYTVFCLYHETCTKSYKDWMFCSEEDARIIIDEIKYWDSYYLVEGNRIPSFSTSVKEDADAVQFFYSMCGYRASIYVDDRVGKQKKNGYFYKNISYQVIPTTQTRLSLERKPGRKVNIEEVYAGEYKYCFTVPTGAFVARRGGNIFITGNSGKSFMSLLYPLKFIDDPWFRGIIFRKTNAEIKAQSGLWEKAQELYGKIYGRKNLKIQQNELKITFPSGASLKFSYLENEKDKYKHQGAEYTFVLFDEGTHFSKSQVMYLLSRIRSQRAKHHKQMILTCNPDPDWFALDWIRPYLLEDGTPNPDMDGFVRYYILDSNTFIWSDSKEELMERYPHLGIPRSFTFISANCHDNIPLLKADPEYPSRLMALDYVDMQRLYKGNWYVRPSKSGFFKREWVTEVKDPPAHSDIEKIVRAYDIAGTLKSDSNPDPDYTASVKMAKLKNGQYIILDVCRFRGRHGDVKMHILENAKRDGVGVDILIPTDPGAAGKSATRMLVQEIIEAGYYATSKFISGNKVYRYRPFSAAAQSGLIEILYGCSNDLENKVYADNSFYYSEQEQFDGGRKGHDDGCSTKSSINPSNSGKLSIETILSQAERIIGVI